MIAKIASDTCKPDGLLAIAPGEEAAVSIAVAGRTPVGHRTENAGAFERLRRHDDRRSCGSRRRATARVLRVVVARGTRSCARHRSPPGRARARNEIDLHRGNVRVRRARRRSADRRFARSSARAGRSTRTRAHRRANGRGEDQARRFHSRRTPDASSPSRRATRVGSFAPRSTACGAPDSKAHRYGC